MLTTARLNAGRVAEHTVRGPQHARKKSTILDQIEVYFALQVTFVVTAITRTMSPRTDAASARSAWALSGWGAWIRTREWRNQNPLPYHLATPHEAVPDDARTIPITLGVIN